MSRMPSRKSKTSPTSLLKAIWERSWTKAWGYTQMGMAATVQGLTSLNSFVTDPHTKAMLDTVTLPQWIIISLAALGFITWLAHGRENDA